MEETRSFEYSVNAAAESLKKKKDRADFNSASTPSAGELMCVHDLSVSLLCQVLDLSDVQNWLPGTNLYEFRSRQPGARLDDISRIFFRWTRLETWFLNIEPSLWLTSCRDSL